ncbi:peroxiredoxin-like family protein [Nocardia sp. NPDC059240]|uniref:peroxiredoxin-like family protein n=1 Tax=Nocardia sp. NPDC059240 TaxID=3346786 RepID=UPI0036AAC938
MPLLTTIPNRVLTTITGAEIPVPDPNRLIHLQFRRFAGCPICNLHLRTITVRHQEIVDAGIREVVVFHSSATELRKYSEGLPFELIADPQRELYREFGVESRPRALLDPRSWPAIVRGVLRDLRRVRRGEIPMPPSTPEGGRLGLPADFLIAPNGRVLAAKHGVHADDQWSVDDLLAHVPADLNRARK